ncbi:TonB-dependent siderophore receptor [Xylophilus sp. ASV27]|uniref:TonB-dependent siderophore receptor n=1 Tax=Xylophilus sp. ASV27 TaxID=2795129 RepID=UPI00351C2FE4
MLFGQGSTAGVVNMVSKRPQAERQGEVGVQLGNFGRRQIQADLTGPLSADGQWLYRLIAVGRDAGTQTEQVPDDRRLLAPSLTWRPSGATSLTLQALYQKDKTGSTSQFLPWQGTILPNPNGLLSSSAFIGQPGDHFNVERRSLGYLLEHRLDDTWTVRQNLRYVRNDVDYLNAYADSFTLPGGWAGDPVNKRLLGRYYYASKTRVETFSADQHLQGAFTTGAVAHQVLAGLDFSRFTTRQASGTEFPVYAGGTVPLIDAYQPVYTPTVLPTLTDSPVNRLRQTGLYVQDQMKWGPWIAVLGLRHDQVNNATAGSGDQNDSANSKRLGLMYAARGGWSPYVSYSESFTPLADQFGQRLKPLRGEQWEAGVKYEPAGRALAFNAAVYDLKEKNRTSNPTPTSVAQLDRTTTRGLELEARGAVTQRLDLTAHYNYTDLDPALEGLPRHQASAWARYRFSIAGHSGFSAGAGVRWFGSFRDRSSGTGPQVPSAALVDALLAYDTPQWRYALNVGNLADKRYFSTCLSRGDCWFGARRTVVASATYRF